MQGFVVTNLIGRKRDGGELSRDEIAWLLSAYLDGEVDDAQMAALLMAGVIQGFSVPEAVALTEAFVASGDRVDLEGLHGPTVDKHSTGGVGDGTTFVVAPLLAALGCQVAKLSGRGLGHTGGTLDKLESIPGFTVDLAADRFRDQVNDIGVAVAAATGDIVPADKRLYALRDVTGTVASPALIASSVMSKKLAGGADHVLLDVKVGDGAFMPDDAEGTALAELCVSIGNAAGRRTGALVTDMSQPLGDAIGNALEVALAIETLRGERAGRFRDLCLDLAAAALELTGVPAAEASDRARRALEDGDALERFRRLVVAQGGDPRVVDDPWSVLPRAPVVRHWSPGAGVIARIGCKRLGELAGQLGAGRRRQGDDIDPAVGLELTARVGDEVDAADPIVHIHARSDADADAVVAALPEVFTIQSDPVDPVALIRARIGVG